MKSSSILPAGWNPKEAADRVLAGLINVCQPAVKGAHDSDFLILDGKAYIVYMANDVQPGENAVWPFVYNAMSVVDVASGRVDRTVVFAASEKVYDNETLPVGACFVPRIVRKDDRILRVFFASENPGKRQSQTWFIDYDRTRGDFDWTIRKAELETAQGVFPMQPEVLFRQAAAEGFAGKPTDYGLYQIDSFKRFDGRLYGVLNAFPVGENAWAILNDAMTRFTVVSGIFQPHNQQLTESAVNRLPDGSWLAVTRQDSGTCNYRVARSRDGVCWDLHKEWEPLSGGTNSKPTFDRFGDLYYLGWQDVARVNGVFRSVFNLDVSRDGKQWERKFRFETEKSFQYPTFREWEGGVYLTVTQGDYSNERKERIMFGRLE